jgi:hypothetical protein
MFTISIVRDDRYREDDGESVKPPVAKEPRLG